MSKIERATIKTIAKEARLTPNTVSLALRNSPLVKEETKAIIYDIAKRQGYVPNIMAESLRSGRSRLIALVFGDLGNPLFAMKTKKMEDALHRQNYQVIIMNTNDDPAAELDAIRTAIGRKVDGVVLCPCQRGRAALDMLRLYQIPCVLVGRSFEDGLEDSVVWDNFTGGYLATKRLLELGCRRILCLLGHPSISTSADRRDGYIAALREAGIPAGEELQRMPTHGHVAEALAGVSVPFDGVFAFSDMLAWEAACHLPDKFPIIGFDNILSFMSLPFSMSSIAADLDEETRHVIGRLLSRIEAFDAPTENIILPVHLAIR